MSLEKQRDIKEKIDVLDFIIHTLQEHEKTLDKLIGQLETLILEHERKITILSHPSDIRARS